MSWQIIVPIRDPDEPLGADDDQGSGNGGPSA
jgi:hypothetical protein